MATLEITWSRSFGDLAKVGREVAGSYAKVGMARLDLRIAPRGRRDLRVQAFPRVARAGGAPQREVPQVRQLVRRRARTRKRAGHVRGLSEDEIAASSAPNLITIDPRTGPGLRRMIEVLFGSPGRTGLPAAPGSPRHGDAAAQQSSERRARCLTRLSITFSASPRG